MELNVTLRHLRVVKGDGIGKKELVPTINMVPPTEPKITTGVYAARVQLVRDGPWYVGALHYGPRPTYGKDQISLEVYLIGVKPQDLPIFSKVETLHIVRRVREIIHFKNSADLRAQIKLDVSTISRVLNMERK
jgi:riboflavin kinase/FMN adenylyltransferase